VGEVVEVRPPQVQAGVVEQGHGEPLLQRGVGNIVDHPPQLRVAVGDVWVDGRGV